MSKIIKLTSQNVKRLSAVEITPDGNLIVIGGKNGQGKSSVIDSIFYALGGKDALPPKPVRDGQPGAEITVDLGELVVTRTFTAAGGTSLVVKNKDGAKYPSPQSILDKLVGTLSFDPMEFVRNEAQQAETLRKLVGLDFKEQDAKAKALYDERTAVNREVKSLAAQVAATTEYNFLPDVEVSTADILKEQREASEKNATLAKNRAAIEEERRFITQCEKNRDLLTDEITKKKAEIVALELQIAEREVLRRNATDQIRSRLEALERWSPAVRSEVDIDLAPFADRARKVDETNQKIRSNKARKKFVESHAAAEAKSKALTEQIDTIEAAKTKAISEAKFPIPGLSFDVNGNVIFNGVPFAQASSAEQTKVSIAIGIALNPTLRVLLIRDGSLLDPDNLAMVADIAEEKDVQVWMERVSTGGEVSVVIEDGMVKS